MKKLMITIVMAALVAMPVFVFAEWQVVPYAYTSDLQSISATPNGTVHTVGWYGLYASGTLNGLDAQPYPEGTNEATDWNVVRAINNDVIYIGGESIVKSLDGGESWTEQFEFSTDDAVYDMDFWNPDSGIAGGDNLTILLYTGSDWNIVYSIPDGGMIRSVKRIAYNTFLAGGWDQNYEGIMLRSDDGGSSWTEIELSTSDFVNGITSLNSTVYVAGPNSIRKSTDNGLSFFSVPQPTEALGTTGIAIVSTDELYAWSSNALYHSPNGGLSWESVYSFGYTIADLDIDTETGEAWLCGDDGLIAYNQSLPLSVDRVSDVIPNGYTLEQNYPNPFNPSTNIEYSIPINESVNIIIYNSLGQTIDVLVDELQSAGTYKVNWNGNSLPSGMYFYQISTPTFTRTMKMVLVK
ncbi:MAG: T9SS type A sorting domain-containing protein [Candidatus Komeilibacteria bacterium]